MNLAVTHERSAPAARSLSTEPENSRAWWFLGTLAMLRNPPGAPSAPTVIELTVPSGGSPPLHIHDTLDDNFLLLEGEVLVRCGANTLVARPGAYVAMPAGVEHTFRVTSAEPAKMLLIHAGNDFLQFIEAVGVPARELHLPPKGADAIDRAALMRAAAAHDVRFVGPALEESATEAMAVERPEKNATPMPGGGMGDLDF